MLSSGDWLEDPLRKIENGSYQFCKLKSLDDRQNDLWRSFHFSTRLKLDAADYFCRQVLGAASMPDYLGLPLLANRQLKWYLDAFFFELMSACDTLLQELNIVYAHDLGLKPKQVRWDNTPKGKLLKDKLPEKLLEYMETGRTKEWFKDVRQYRNMAAHIHYVPTISIQTGWGDKPWDYVEHEMSICYVDDTGKLKEERIGACPTYLKNMVRHIQQVWKEMAQEFQ